MRKLEVMIVSLLACLAALTAVADMEETSRTAAADANATPSAKLTDDQLGDLLQQAILLARVGLYDEAEARCRQILRQRPDQPTVKHLLIEIQQQSRHISGLLPGAALKQRLTELIVPEVNARQARAADVIESLRAESRRLTAGKGEINFVWQVPKVTLSLKNVPMLDVIRYLTELANLSYRIDEHAVVIYLPKGTDASKVAPGPSDPHGQP